MKRIIEGISMLPLIPTYLVQSSNQQSSVPQHKLTFKIHNRMKVLIIEIFHKLLNKELSFWRLIAVCIMILCATYILKPESGSNNTYNFNGWFCNNHYK
jgi:hypothetical protein